METNAKNLPKSFTPDTVMKGNQGEAIVAYMLRNAGYFATCLSDINEQGGGGAPGMRSNETFLILPDLQAALNGKLGYCEVKWKEKATYTRITGIYDHGIDKANWDHYQEIMRMTGIDTFLFIYEHTTGDVLYGHIDFLATVLRYSPKMGRGGMCFFPRGSFRQWGRIINMGEEYYEQLTIFSPKIGGQGDQLFGVTIFDRTLKK